MNKKNKICIIGIDGATFDLIMPWMEAGYLPNFKRLISEGAHGYLRSSIPENSAPAWTSIVTGKNPGKHGIFGFTSPGETIARIRIENGSSRGAVPIWRIFNQNQQRACVINVPLTFPPEEVDGIMISGMDTPNTDAAYTHPRHLKTELNRMFGRYKIEPEVAGTWTQLNEKGQLAYIKEVHQIAASRCSLARHLLKKEEWPFFMVVFVATDRIQHKFWAEMNMGHPFHRAGTDSAIKGAVLDTYILMDSFVGEIDAMLSEDTTLIIVSDHGFGPRSPKVISINRLLEINGYLAYSTKDGNRTKGVSLASLKHILSDLARQRLSPGQQNRIKKMFPFLRGKGFSALQFANIDWSRTRAFADEPMGLVWINRRERFRNGVVGAGEEYEDVVNGISGLLKGLNDQETGDPILSHVLTKQDAYNGEYLRDAPDILFSYSEGYSFPESTSISGLFKENAFIGRAKTHQELLQITGIHRPFGIIMLRGQPVEKGSVIKDVNVADVMPTALYLSGNPISEDVDGRVIEEVIKEDFRVGNPPRYAKEFIEKRPGRKGRGFKYTQEEEEEMEKRLKGLGYL